MRRRGFLWLAFCSALLGGCDSLFGINDGLPAGQGGGTTSTTGHCTPYDGSGDVSITDVSTSNFAAVNFGAGMSVKGTYDGTYSYFSISGDENGYCSVGVDITLMGAPQVGDYALAGAPLTVGSPSNQAFVSAGGGPSLDGGCDVPKIFASMPGLGKVTVSSVQGTVVKLTVSGVQATGVNSADCLGEGFPCDGQGTIGIDLNAESDCFSSQ